MDDEQRKALRDWTKLLHPMSLKANLVLASLFLSAFEMLMGCVVEQLMDYWLIGIDDQDPSFRQNYHEEVLARHKRPDRASLLWFQEMGAIDDADVQLVTRITDHRNAIAHELPEFIASANREVDVTLLGDLCSLVAKIDRWWIREIEMPTKSQFDGLDPSQVPDSQILSGRMISLSLLIDVATRDEDEAMASYNRFVEQAARQWPS